MAWIESHETLRHHPKTRRLARRLGCNLVQTIGHLHCLWWWCLSYAQDGNLSRHDTEDIAEGGAWEGDAQDFLAALVETGFADDTDDGTVLHDWHDYAGKLIERRRAAVERAKRSKGATDEDATRNLRAGYAQPTRNILPTVPNPTVPNQHNTTTPTVPTPPTDNRAAAVVTCWEDNGYGIMPSVVLTDVDDYGDECGMETGLILYALELAAQGTPDQRKWSYVRGILERFKRNGWTRRAQAEAHAKARQGKPAPAATEDKPIRYHIPDWRDQLDDEEVPQ